MSSLSSPETVVLYALTREGSVPAARFRWGRSAGVTLDVLDERWAHVARTTFRDGVTLPGGRRVTPADGKAFMRALLEPTRTTYYYFVDESSGRERRPHPEPLTEPQPGWRLCPECGGARYCPVCDGQGWREGGQRCRMCGGTGECYYCGGGGEVRDEPVRKP